MDYFSPEQARAEDEPGARSDIFWLANILYQLLMGVMPFRADPLREQIRRICESDPVLPRRTNAAKPGDLQDVCMNAWRLSLSQVWRSPVGPTAHYDGFRPYVDAVEWAFGAAT